MLKNHRGYKYNVIIQLFACDESASIDKDRIHIGKLI